MHANPAVHPGTMVYRGSSLRAYGNWACFPGSSGGPIIDMETKEVVGVHLAEVYHAVDEDDLDLSKFKGPRDADAEKARRESLESVETNTSNSSTEDEANPSKKRRIFVVDVKNQSRSQLALFVLSHAIKDRFFQELDKQQNHDNLYD
jgi:hypothetical protein